MGRGFYILGDTKVTVKGTNLLGGTQTLGLCEGPVKVTPRYKHMDIKADDFGGDIPPEVLWMLADATVHMTLVHFDPILLEACLALAMGNNVDGKCGGAGMPLGAAGNLLSLGIAGTNYAWRFPSSYLSERPASWPMGTERSQVELQWRAIPYVGFTTDIRSLGAVVWDHTLD